MIQSIDKLRRDNRLEVSEYRELLANINGPLLEYAMRQAREVAVENFGTGIYIRGLIEITNYCRNDCYYCGLRKSNLNVERYRLTKEQILECCRTGDKLGFKTFVLQGGEDAALSDTAIEDIVLSVKHEFPDTAITLSLGERSREAYRRFFDAGADRYLLRHETACSDHYGQLHPQPMSYDNRMDSLKALKDIGYQTGTGIMVGSPGQTLDNIIKDILFIENFKPEMIGIGPYLPQGDTPFHNEKAGSIDTTLMLLSIFRLMFPHALIPSTTALSSITGNGREQGILAGANVVMPNLSPAEQRKKYAIYDNKKATGLEAAEGLKDLEKQLNTIGYHISYEKGDHKKNS